ncbi:hypothetical protein RV420_400521 [Roseovarius sp. EC-SD190]|nr:hypothetical protein RV420_400521 [Roseovarius sp. EC-SD190]
MDAPLEARDAMPTGRQVSTCKLLITFEGLGNTNFWRFMMTDCGQRFRMPVINGTRRNKERTDSFR